MVLGVHTSFENKNSVTSFFKRLGHRDKNSVTSFFHKRLGHRD